MKRDSLRDLLVALAVAVAVAGATVTTWSGPYRGLDVDYLHGLRAALAPADPAPSRAVVVAIDEATFRAAPFAGLPKVMWTPQVAKVQDAVVASGAAVFGWDLILPTTAAAYVADRDFDRPLLLSLFRHKAGGRVVLGSSQVRGAATYPHKSFSWAAGGNANIRSLDVIADADGVVRRAPLGLKFKGDGKVVEVPGMALELARRAGGADPDPAPGGGLLLNFADRPGAVPTHSLADLLRCAEAGNTDYFKQHFKNAVVLFGQVLDFEDRKVTSARLAAHPDGAAPPPPCTPAPAPDARTEAARAAAGLRDQVARGSIPGVYVHATAVNNILAGDALRPLGPPLRQGTVFALALAAAAAALLLSPALSAPLLALAAAAWTALAVALFRGAVVLPLLDPLVAGGVTAVVLYAYRFTVADRDKRFLRTAFASYVSPNLVEELARDPGMLKLGGERREVTSLFTDLEGFTTLVEKTDPQTVARVLNAYLDGVVSIVFDHQGTIDKVIGDAVSVIFSAPLAQPDHARRAVDCARAIDAFARDFTRRQNADGVPLGKTRIGVNSGVVLVGNFGGSRFFDYTAHGDAINTAARLEGVNKYLGTAVCVAGTTARLCPGFTGRPVGDLVLKGKTEAVAAFEPLTPERLATGAVRDYITAFGRMRDGDPGAEAAFADLVARHPDDPLAAFHLARLRAGETGTTIVLRDK
ncbi:MAG: adenylate/guanylate cyclase domain-containing protein [Hyphomicrobiales bacterium]|nr:adenylate/guanylate cyclase domain-containing protein [Hyphomicrobiales bacterium]